jgi:hypothetical protein
LRLSSHLTLPRPPPVPTLKLTPRPSDTRLDIHPLRAQHPAVDPPPRDPAPLLPPAVRALQPPLDPPLGHRRGPPRHDGRHGLEVARAHLRRELGREFCGCALRAWGCGGGAGEGKGEGWREGVGRAVG